jgi:phenylalanyl-tRNA synthetase beta chain
MEAANWHGPNIQRTSQRLNLRTEASARFEKGIAPEQGLDGQAVATRLMLELTGARLADGTVDVGGPRPELPTLPLRASKVAGLLGADVPVDEQAELLRRIGFVTSPAEHGLDVTVPYWRRNDVTREVDLIEEVARLWGLEKLPSTLPSRHDTSGRLEPEQRLRRRAGDALVGAGFSEAIGWSFQAPEMNRRLRIPDAPAVHIRNPLSEDLSVMRTTLLGSLLDSLRHNRARGAEDIRLFEEGTVILDRPHAREPTAAERRATPLPDEHLHLAALLTGRVRPASWRDPQPPEADFFAAKGALVVLLDALRVPWRVERGEAPFLHPGRAARVLVAGEPAGWLGELHPGVAADWDLNRVAGFELDLGAVLPHAVVAPVYEDLTSYPSIRMDLAFWMPADRTAAELVDVARTAGGKLLRRAAVFDVYTREGQTSLALRLEFRAGDRTLTDEEIAPLRDKIVSAVADKLEGRLRG